jgi:hypothetical protein
MTLGPILVPPIFTVLRVRVAFFPVAIWPCRRRLPFPLWRLTQTLAVAANLFLLRAWTWTCPMISCGAFLACFAF